MLSHVTSEKAAKSALAARIPVHVVTHRARALPRNVRARDAIETVEVKVEIGKKPEEQAVVEEAKPEPPVPSTEPTLPPTAGPNNQDAIMLQGFHWESHNFDWYNIVKGLVTKIKEAGVTHIWLPPPSKSVAPQGYMPSSIYDVNSAYGSKEALIDLVSELKAQGIHPVCDIVINHRCADGQDHKGRWNNYVDDGADHGNTPVNWDQWAITNNDPHFGGQGNPDTGADFDGAPDLDHTNPQLRQGLIDWMNWLKNEIGFTSWRFDFVKGYGPQFVEEYCRETVGSDVLNVGELWTDLNWGGNGLEYDQNGARQATVDWINGTGKHSTAFDFVTKGVLQEAMKNCEFWRLRDPDNKPAGVIGWWPKRSVTFIENHDTGSTQAHWPFPADKVTAGYAYILTHPGIPCLFWDHVFDWGDDVRNQVLALVDIRRRNGINSSSTVEIQCADHDMYVAKIANKVMVKLGPRGDMGGLVPREEDGWKICAFGNWYAVWERK